MNELANCANCNQVFVKTVRDICRDCYEAEEKAFEIVYRFLSKRKNREATLKEIVEETEVEESLIIKFIKEKRLRTSQFPKLAYPCKKCKRDIVSGRLCQTCSEELIHGWEQHEKIETRRAEAQQEREKQANIYYSYDHKEK